MIYVIKVMLDTFYYKGKYASSSMLARKCPIGNL